MDRSSSYTYCLIAAFLALLTSAVAARAETFRISVDGGNAAGCGTVNPCGTLDYFLSSGCDADGCANDVAAGDEVLFAPGSYTGDGAGGAFEVGFTGTAGAPVRVRCDGAPGNCVISGAGISLPRWAGFVSIGNGYVVFEGFRVEEIPSGAYGISLPGSHLVVRSVTVDGGSSGSDALLIASNRSHITVVGSTFTNCPAASTGCVFLDIIDNLAVVGSDFGPVASGGNYDCTTFINVDVGLLDGNTCRDTADGFDEGMNEDGGFERVIVRYNYVYGSVGAGRAYPLSGNGGQLQSISGRNVLHNNVALAGRFELYGGATGIELWNNTTLSGNGYGANLWLDAQYGGWVESILVRQNVFEAAAGSSPSVVLDRPSGGSDHACPPGARCPFIDNVFSAAGLTPENTCVFWGPSDAPEYTSYACSDLAHEFNQAEHSGNRYVAPGFMSRPVSTLADIQPRADSTLVDAGTSFCHTRSAGSGNTVAVQCDAGDDARFYFPSPADYFGLDNDDCRGRGVRAASGVDSGCFEVRVQGCGVRQVVSVAADAIELAGDACSWDANAMVHAPFAGEAPDVGALESPADTIPPAAPTGLQVQ